MTLRRKRSWRWKAVSCGLSAAMLTTGLAVSQTAADAQTQAPAATPSASSMPSEPSSLVGGETKRKSSLTIHTELVGGQRLGGESRYEVSVNNGGGHPVAHPTVKIKPPVHAQVVKYIETGAWRCEHNGICRWPSAIAVHQGADKIVFVTRSDASKVRKPQEQLQTSVTWRAAKHKAHTKVSSVSKPWTPTPGLRLKATSPTLLDDINDSSSPSDVLRGFVAGINNTNFSYAWRQICSAGDSCPKVKWDGRTSGVKHGASGKPEVAISFRPLGNKAVQHLTFELQVGVEGATVSKRVAVTVKPTDLTTKPGTPDFGPLVKQPVKPRAASGAQPVSPVSHVQIDGPAIRSAAADQIVELRALEDAQAPQVADVQWAFSGPQSDQVVVLGVPGSDHSVQFVTPKDFSDPLIVSAKVSHVDGTSSGASTTVVPESLSDLAGAQPVDIAGATSDNSWLQTLTAMAHNAVSTASGQLAAVAGLTKTATNQVMSGGGITPTNSSANHSGLDASASTTPATPQSANSAIASDSQSPTASASASSSPSPSRSLKASNAGFCVVYQQLANGGKSLTFDGITLSFTTVTLTGSSCTAPDASVKYSGGSMTVDGTAFTNLAGTIAPTGLSIDSGQVSLPTDPGVPGSLTTNLAFTSADGKQALQISFNDSGLSTLSGTAQGLPFAYLPLPDGWKVSKFMLTFSHDSSGYAIAVEGAAAGPTEGTATMSGSISTDGAVNLNVAVANIWHLVGSDGSNAVFDGSGTITRAAGSGQTVNYNITAKMATSPDGFKIYGGVMLEDMQLSWTSSGFQVSGNATMEISDKEHHFPISGTLTSFDNWTVQVKSDYSIDMRYLSLKSLTGTMSMTPDKGLAMSLSADITQVMWADATLGSAQLQVDKAIPYLGIFCDSQPQKASQPCKDKTVQFQLDLSGYLYTQGTHSPQTSMYFNATADVDVATGDFNFEFTPRHHPTGIGPQDMNLHGFEFFYTDQPKTEPALQNSVCMTDSTLLYTESVLGAIAQFSYPDGLGGTWDGQVLMVYSNAPSHAQGNNAMCIEYQTADGKSNSTVNNMVPGGLGKFNAKFMLLYTTFQANLALTSSYPDAPGPGTPMIPIPRETITIAGEFTGAEKLIKSMGSPALGTVLLELGMQSRSITGLVSKGDGALACMVGKCDPEGTHTYAQLETVGLELAQGGHWEDGSSASSNVGPKWVWSGGISCSFVISVNIVTPSSKKAVDPHGTTFNAQVMPLYGSIGVIFSSKGIGLTVTAQMGDGSLIKNAFNVSGLNIFEFRFQGTLSPIPEESSIGFGASVETGDPDTTLGNITHMLGIANDTPINLAIQIGGPQPCFIIGIGNPSGTTTAINWKVITANYLELVIAPNGCTVAPPGAPGAQGRVLDAGYAFNFNGSVLGTGVYVGGNIQSYNNPFSKGALAEGELEVDVDSFSLAGIGVQKTVLEISFNFSYDNASFGKFDVAFQGGVNVWGALLVHVQGKIDFKLGMPSTADIELAGTEESHLFGVFSQSMQFSFKAQFSLQIWGIWKALSLDVSASSAVDIYIVKGAASIVFDYNDGIVNQMTVSLSVELNLYFVRVGASATLSYTRPPTGGDGLLYISVSGNFTYWFFGWHHHSGNIFTTSVPIHFDNPHYPPPPPAPYANGPLDPPPLWQTGTWDYTSQMFMGINWDRSELAKAAGISDPSSLVYGVAQTDKSLGTPSVTYPNSSVTFDSSGPGDRTSGSIAVAVTLPESQTYAQVLANAQGHVPPARINRILPSLKNCAGGATKTINVNVPQWQGGVPQMSSSAALIVSEVNWRLYLSSVIEATSIAGGRSSTPLDALENFKCGFGNTGAADPWASFPSLQQWLATNSQGIQFNLAYPQPHPGDISQFCLDGVTPGTPYAQQCAANIAALNGSWGTGWGAGDTSGPPG